MTRATSYPIPLLFIASTLGLTACVAPTAPEGGGDADTDAAGTGGEGNGTEAPGSADSGTPTGDLEVRGGIASTASALRATFGIAAKLDPQAGQCPFIYEPNPCQDPACGDQTSAECFDAVGTYCAEHPDDPTCQQGPGGDPDSGGDTGPGGDGQWACDVDPEYPPCQVCLAPNTPPEDCEAAWNDHCSTAEPDDPWCQGGPGGGEGGDPGPCQGSPDDPAPCEVCMDPSATPDACEAAWQDYCSEHFADPICMGPPPDEVYTPSSMAFKVLKIQLSQDAQNCSDPITVAESEVAEYIDFFDRPVLMTGELPPAGEYPCVIITMTDWIKWGLDAGSQCDGEHTQDVQGERDVEEVMTIYLSTAGSRSDAPGDHDQPFSPPGFLLDSPFVSGPDVLYSEFVVAAEDIVEYRSGQIDRPCDMQPPRWGFNTVYTQ